MIHLRSDSGQSLRLLDAHSSQPLCSKPWEAPQGFWLHQKLTTKESATQTAQHPGTAHRYHLTKLKIIPCGAVESMPFAFGRGNTGGLSSLLEWAPKKRYFVGSCIRNNIRNQTARAWKKPLCRQSQDDEQSQRNSHIHNKKNACSNIKSS